MQEDSGVPSAKDSLGEGTLGAAKGVMVAGALGGLPHPSCGLPCPRGAGLSMSMLRVGGLQHKPPLGGLLSLLLLLLIFMPCSKSGVSCGHYHPFRKVIHGNDAIPAKWPWQASLQVRGRHFCGGALIASKWVLTAAHCVIWDFDYTVKLGDVSLYHTSESINAPVKDIIIYPSYKEIFSFRNDLALIRLESPVTFTQTIQPICLPSNRLFLKNGTQCWVTGWGFTKENRVDSIPDILQEADLYILGRKQCSKMLKKSLFILKIVPIINKNVICAYHPKGKDSCQGDSGGALACEIGQHTWVQAGIVSWGFGCGKPEIPGVYTRVSSFSKWIINIINKNDSSFWVSSCLTFVSMLLPLCILITL